MKEKPVEALAVQDRWDPYISVPQERHKWSIGEELQAKGDRIG